MDDDDFRDDLKEYSDKDAPGEKMNYEMTGKPDLIPVDPYNLEELDEELDALVENYLTLFPGDALIVRNHPNFYGLLDTLRRDGWLSINMSKVVDSNIPEENKREQLASLIFTAMMNVRTTDSVFQAELDEYGEKFAEMITEILTTMMLG
jgi:hypothetical protein